jgi:uncharacterized protein with FMN-binding domain
MTMNNSAWKQYIITGMLLAAFVIYLIFTNKDSTLAAATPNVVSPVVSPGTTVITTTSTGGIVTITITINTNGTVATTSVTTATSTAVTTPTPVSVSAAKGKYKDGTYTGSAADAFYGTLQAVAVIQNGAIVDVQFPQYPSDGHSNDVSAMALPVLKQEAITAQSAQVDIVSGATQDSQAFQQSLAVALAQAKN